MHKVIRAITNLNQKREKQRQKKKENRQKMLSKKQIKRHKETNKKNDKLQDKEKDSLSKGYQALERVPIKMKLETQQQLEQLP